jgi:uncharacterized RDD family membrane protein YckC
MPLDKQKSSASPQDFPSVGLFRLLLVMLYDAIIVFAILMVAGAIALKLPFSRQVAGEDFAYTVYLLSAWFFYLAWCWRKSGMTLGMRAWKVRLVSTRAENMFPAKDRNPAPQPPSWWQCGLRFAGAWVSALCAGLGYAWILVDRQHMSWHDRLSGTRLVYAGKL